MANTVKVKRSGTASATPSSLEHGELALNYADKKLFFKDGSNTIQSFVFADYAAASHTQAWSTITSTPTTLSGYGITDAAPAASPTFTGDVTIPDKIVHAGDSDTSIRFSADNAVSVQTAGDDRLRIDSGLRVLQPPDGTSVARMSLLAASGTTIAAENLLYGDSYTASSLMGIGAGGFVIYGAARPVGICTTGSNGILFGTNVAERMRITGTGRVGIGTTSPASALDVAGVITVAAGSAAAPALVSGTGTSDSGIYWPAADAVAISTAGTERVRVDSSGRLLVGATTGTFPLTVVADSGARGLQVRGRASDGISDIHMTSNDGATRYGYINSRAAYMQFRGPENGYIDFADHGATSRMVIKATGAVRFVPLAADPATGETGDVYYNSANNKLRVYNGTSWVDLH
jgi:hypothetical protein